MQRFITNLRKLYRVKQNAWQSEQLQVSRVLPSCGPLRGGCVSLASKR